MRHRIAIAIAVATLCAAPLTSQVITGTIMGTVTDESASQLAGVALTVKNLDTGQTHSLVTDV